LGDTIADLALKVDQEIAAGYAVWSTNYLAHDLLQGRQAYAAHYTAEERDAFSAYVGLRSREILAEPLDARHALLSLYARPVSDR
jgi:hypothetical protein